MRPLLAALLGLALTRAAAAQPPVSPAPADAAVVVADDDELREMTSRLVGVRFRAGDGLLHLDDVAGLGRPWVGPVVRAGQVLVLQSGGRHLELAGALARPRIAGPGYLVWVVGRRVGDVLTIERIGVLAPPRF
ncbi:MAG: hypothetical protein KBG28_24175 [Kofleriaceae bacterium]|nr:hypothetical protein [Kofleriaceae bacterium]MBP9207088.1 hypothetical protein [Kofleriaceae bacterium]